MFAVLLPTTLPMAMPGEPAKAAWRLVTSSGIEVPKPTMVSPISSGETRSRVAKATAPRTSRSPPTTSSASPAASSRNSMERDPPPAGASAPRTAPVR